MAKLVRLEQDKSPPLSLRVAPYERLQADGAL